MGARVRLRWTVRVAGLGVLVAALYVGFAIFDYQPRLVPLALLATVCVATIWLAIDTLGDLGPSWDVPPLVHVVPPGEDAWLGANLRIVESHVTSTTPDGALRQRLGRLADQRLSQRHGLSVDDPRAAELIGPELLSVLDDAPRRLRVEEIERLVRRIEEM